MGRRGRLWRPKSLWLRAPSPHSLSYAFGVPFNNALLGYAAILGISSYLLFIGLMRVDVGVAGAAMTRVARRATAWVFAVVGTALALLR